MRVCRGFPPEGFTVLGIEINRPDPVHLPVRAEAEGVYREVVEPVATGRCSGFMDQADGRAVIGVDAMAVLVKGVTEESRELHEHESHVILAAGAVGNQATEPGRDRDMAITVRARTEVNE